MTKRDQKFIEIIKKVARDIPTVGNHRLAACIVKSNKIISFGHNQQKTHPLQLRFARNKNAVYLHAEIDVIRNALRDVSLEDLSKSTLYIARVKKNGDEGISKPCKGCMSAIETFGIKRVVFTTEEQGIYGEYIRKS